MVIRLATGVGYNFSVHFTLTLYGEKLYFMETFDKDFHILVIPKRES